MIPRRKAHLYPGELAEVRRWLESGVPSDSLAKWEAGVAELVGVGGAAAVCSGRIAMVIVLNHLGIGPGDEVILPAYTLKDLATLIEGTGARAVPADIDLLTLNASPASVEGRITSRTKAILALHAFGSPCRIREMCALGKKHGIHVIEDCAHALGAHVEGRSVGSFGTAAFFSFETTKPVNTFGGGMLVSDDAALITEARAANAQGAIDLQGLRRKIRSVQVERFMFATGLSFPLLYLLASPRWSGLVAHLYRQAQSVPRQDASYMPIQAALGLQKLRGLRERIRMRTEKATLLSSLLKQGIRSQHVEDGCASTWYFLVVRLPCRASTVRRGLLLRGIDAGIGDEVADNCAEFLGYSDCPHIQEVHDRVIALPIFEGISRNELTRIARRLNALIS